MEIGIAHFFLFISSMFSLSLFFYTLTRKHSPLNISFGLFALTCAFYALGYGFELLSVNLDDMLFWSRIQYIGIPFQSALFILFSICYIGKDGLLTAKRVFLIFLIPVISFIARWTNPHHLLFYSEPSIYHSSIGPLLSFKPGPFYYLHISYLIIALILATVLLVRFLIGTLSLYRNQALLIVGALIIQWSALLIYLLGISPDNFDINPFMFSISALLYGIGIYRFSLFDIAPVARATVFDEMQDAVLVFDPEMRLVDFNKRCSALFDNVNKKNIGRDIKELFNDFPVILKAVSGEILPETVFSCEEENKLLSFKFLLQQLSGRKGRTVGSILTFHDVTEQKKLMAELENLAAIDSLTGIFNRRQLLWQAEVELKRSERKSEPVSMMMIDIDHFKLVNDTYGHQCGDLVLQEFTKIAEKNVRGIDIFGRYGGEEFVIVMPETGKAAAMEISERLRVKTEEMIVKCKGRNINITVSIGLSGNWELDRVLIDKLIGEADKALYKAKQSGRNRVCSS